MCMIYDDQGNVLVQDRLNPVFWVKRAALNQYVLAEYMEEMLKVFEDESVSELFFYNENGLKCKLL